MSYFLQNNKCKSANTGSSTVQLHCVDLIDIQIDKKIRKKMQENIPKHFLSVRRLINKITLIFKGE